MSKKISLCGILLALNIVFLILVNIFMTNTLFFMGLASLPISIVIMRFGPKSGFIFYLGSALLSFMVLANKAHWIVYIFTFGIYGLVKYLIESDRNIVIEYILKLLYANICLFIMYMIIKQFMHVPVKAYLLIIFEIAFLVYDYAYSLFIDFYYDRLEKIIHRK